ncbi:MAG: hypothetical protein KAR40_06100 [Candidatus Sabulitectum sp.]|nr:hypothetical protein [Candidatus Sabulitectum sp.]
MGLKVTHDTIDDVPEGYRELYTEREGKFHLTGVEGVKTQVDIDRIMQAKTHVQEEKKELQTKLDVWGELNHDEVMGKLDRFDELDLAAKGNKEDMDAKLDELTEKRIGSRLAPVERENKRLTTDLAKALETVGILQAAEVKRTIDDSVRKEATKIKVIPEAIDDVIMLANAVFEVTEDGQTLTKENPFGITPGLTAEGFLQDMQEKRPHWWPKSEGSGATGSLGGGSFGKNPWTHDNWNMTEQAKVFRGQGAEIAAKMAKAAGTTVGGQMPPEK